jgi:hypothetical protein
MPPFDQTLRIHVIPKNAKCGSNIFALVFIAALVVFKDTNYILYYEIHLEYYLYR